MHEYSIVQALIDRVQVEVEARRASAVRRIRVRIGELSGVEIELLQSAYDIFRDRSVCAGAELEVIPIAAVWSCPGCGQRMRRGEILRCDACELPARLETGDEILLERLEMEVA